MSEITTSVAIAIIVLILAGIGIAITHHNTSATNPTSGEKPAPPASNNTSPSKEETTTTNPKSEESYNKPVKTVKELNLAIGEYPNVIKISKFSITIYAGTGNVTVDMVLPNPCYTANLKYISENATILLSIKSPSQGTMCIQVVKPKTLSTSITPPETGSITFIVVVDGKAVATVPVTLPS